MQFPGTRVFEQRRPSEQKGSGCKETSVKLKRPKQSEWMVGIKARHFRLGDRLRPIVDSH